MKLLRLDGSTTLESMNFHRYLSVDVYEAFGLKSRRSPDEPSPSYQVATGYWSDVLDRSDLSPDQREIARIRLTEAMQKEHALKEAQTLELQSGRKTDWSKYGQLIEDAMWYCPNAICKYQRARCLACGDGLNQPNLQSAVGIWESLAADDTASGCANLYLALLECSQASSDSGALESATRFCAVASGKWCDCASRELRTLESAHQIGGAALMTQASKYIFASVTRNHQTFIPARRDYLQSAATHAGFEWADVVQATQRFYPNYHMLSEEGVPLPGKIAHFSTRGFSEVTGIVVDWRNRGLILCGVESTDQCVPLIFDQDWLVANLLVFGPAPWQGELHFSLESTELGSKFPFREKQIHPTWLEGTALGSSLYFADYLMKQLSGGGLLSIDDPSITRSWADLRNEAPTPDWLEQLGLGFSGTSPERWDWWRFCLKLKAIDIVKSSRSAEGFEEFSCVRAEMFIESSYCLTSDETGKENREIALNDCSTPLGAKAKSMTEHYNEIAEIFPAWARLREVFKLVKILETVRDSGFALSVADCDQLLKTLQPESVWPVQRVPEFRMVSPHFNGNPSGGADMFGCSVNFVKEDDCLSAARAGTNTHSEWFAAARAAEVVGPFKGWGLMGIDQTMGGSGRPDFVYVNHEEKRFVIEDLYTGKKSDVGNHGNEHESLSHAQKGWSYRDEPTIAGLRERGYCDDGYRAINPKVKH